MDKDYFKEMDLALIEDLRLGNGHESSVIPPCVEKIRNGDYISIIESPEWNEVLGELSSPNWALGIEQAIQAYLTSKENSSEIKLQVFTLGLACLQTFIQINWTGPDVPSAESYSIPWMKGWYTDKNDLQNRLFNFLVLDGESICPMVQNLELLLIARAVLEAECIKSLDYSFVSLQLALFHCLFIHQQVLEEPSNILFTDLCTLAEALLQDSFVICRKLLRSTVHLEYARMFLHYDNVSKSHEEIKKAFELLELEVNLIGALGKRTKYQEKELAQLTLKVNVETNPEEEKKSITTSHFPKDVLLEDDVRLNKIAFSDRDVTNVPIMSEIHQAAIFILFMYKKKSQPNDNIRTEELMPFLTCLISQPQIWSLQMSALFCRSKLESNHSRTVERSLMQVQALVDSLSDLAPTVSQRLHMFHTSFLPSRWQLEAEMANMLVSLGAVQSALDVFLRLQMWEEVIACYNHLKLRHKAAEIVRQELDKKETVKMWCLLGDATDDISCYEKAWNLSCEKSARAQRHWALYYFTRKQYAESIPHIESSLFINSLQVSLWFALGYAALEVENWELCATAYRRYCTLEPESFEAWNNLAKAYVKIGNKARAYRALQEAVKCNYENWRVWDNLMIVSTDCADFEEVIRSYHRVLDLKEKHLDVEVLKILTNVIVKDLPDCQKLPSSRLRKKALALFGRLTSQILNDATLWQLYAELTASLDEQTNESRVKIAQYLQRSHRVATQGNWDRDVESCDKVIKLSKDLAQAYLTCKKHCETSQEAVQFLCSAKLSLKGVISRIEREQKDILSGELPDSLQDSFTSLQAVFNSIVGEISQLQASS